MDRNHRFEALALAEAAPLMELAERLLADMTPDEHFVQSGTMMLRLREPVAADLFNMGEVLVTEASAAIDGARGYAMRLGLDAEATLAAALLDAAVAANHPLSPEIDLLLVETVRADAQRRREQWREVAATRVVFDEM